MPSILNKNLITGLLLGIGIGLIVMVFIIFNSRNFTANLTLDTSRSAIGDAGLPFYVDVSPNDLEFLNNKAVFTEAVKLDTNLAHYINASAKITISGKLAHNENLMLNIACPGCEKTNSFDSLVTLAEQYSTFTQKCKIDNQILYAGSYESQRLCSANSPDAFWEMLPVGTQFNLTGNIWKSNNLLNPGVASRFAPISTKLPLLTQRGNQYLVYLEDTAEINYTGNLHPNSFAGTIYTSVEVTDLSNTVIISKTYAATPDKQNELRFKLPGPGLYILKVTSDEESFVGDLRLNTNLFQQLGVSSFDKDTFKYLPYTMVDPEFILSPIDIKTYSESGQNITHFKMVLPDEIKDAVLRRQGLSFFLVPETHFYGDFSDQARFQILDFKIEVSK